ncbi:MAG: hypothetical protein ACFE95_09955 [Candidatus Hodarchaeota archaeon]
MNEVQDSIIESIIFTMSECEKAKKAQNVHRKTNDHLDLIISSTNYYIRVNLWLLQSGKDTNGGEIFV